MIPKVVTVEYVRDYTLRLCFSDGTKAEIDLSSELHGAVFEPLRKHDFFRKVAIHPDFHTLVWPNGADLAPEFVYEKTRVIV